MSTIASWDAGVTRPSGSMVQDGRQVRCLRFLQAARRDLRNVPRYGLKHLTIVLALLGLFFLWASIGDGPMPPITRLSPSLAIDPYQTSSTHCILEGTCREVRWEGLVPVLAILDDVNPDVAEWVRTSYGDGSLIFTDSYRTGNSRQNHLAKFDALRRELTISRSLFAENDGTVAAVLCHEYRHSRQRFPTTLRYALSMLLIEGGDPSIVETEAELYEQQALSAIFGPHDETCHRPILPSRVAMAR